MSRDLRVQLVAAAIMLVALVFSGVMAADVSASVGRNHLTYMDTAEEGDPPQVAVGIAMGAFRGLFVNMLWMRANDLKEDGKFYEAMELSRAITRLQPRFNQVWVFHAWNMAYNISVTTQTPQERWQWVNNGIRLLRDEGLRYNPNDMLIHKELAWIFLHKVGGFTDDSNQYYKRHLAMEWTELLGAPPRPTPESMRSRDVAVQNYVDWLQPVADAPDTMDEAIAMEASVQTLIDRLRAAGATVDRRLLAFSAFHEAIGNTSRRGLYLPALSPIEREAFNIADDPALRPAWDLVLAHLRKRALRDDYNMEPERMIRYTRKYGPIDWRHPAAHALYWAARGVEQGLDRATVANRKDWDFVNTDRMVIQAVQELYRSGELFFGYLDFRSGTYSMYHDSVNAHFFDTYGDIIQELKDRSWADSAFSSGRARGYSFYQAGYENFLQDGVRFFYRRGQRQKAEEILERYRSDPGRNVNITNTVRIDEDSLTLDDWVATQYGAQRWTSPYVAEADVTGALQGAFASLLAGDKDMFESQFGFAAQFHAKYFEGQQRRATSATQDDQVRMDQLEPDFRFLAGSYFAQFVSVVDLEHAERMYDLVPEDLRRFAYDLLVQNFKPGIDQVASQLGRSFEEMFPEPARMEEFRQWYTAVFNQRAQRERQVESR